MTTTHFDHDDAVSDRLAEQRAQREAQRAATQAFRPVDQLPRVRTGYGARPIPSVRQALIDYCRAHPGQWVEYTPTPEQDPVKPNSLAGMVRKQHGGFTGPFEVTLHNKVPHLRYGGDR